MFIDEASGLTGETPWAPVLTQRREIRYPPEFDLYFPIRHEFVPLQSGFAAGDVLSASALLGFSAEAGRELTSESRFTPQAAVELETASIRT